MKLSAKGLADCINLSDKLKHLTIHTSNKFVYAILYSDMVVKVGMTKNLRQRVSSLKNGREISDCFVVFSGMGSKVERSAQDRLSDHLINDEYFSCDFGDAAKSNFRNGYSSRGFKRRGVNGKRESRRRKDRKVH